MSSKISQSQRSAPLLLKLLQKFVANLQAGELGAVQAPRLGWAPAARRAGWHRQREAPGEGALSTPHLQHCGTAAAEECLVWGDQADAVKEQPLFQKYSRTEFAEE